MKDCIGLFVALGDRLCGFDSDDASREVIARACRANEWFTPADIRHSVKAIAGEMLCREKLEAWLSHYPAPVAEPRRVLVVMAGNIPLVGFFDLLCVLAAGHGCLVKPSTKDSVLMEYIVELLHELDPAVPVEMYDGKSAVDAVIATGSDNANRYFRTRYAGISSLLRGSRQSVAVLSGNETPEQLAGLADDIWAYSGLGCRSVSLIFAPNEYKVKLEVAAVNNKYINNYKQEKSLLKMTGKPFSDLGCAVLVEQRAFPMALSEIAVSHYESLEEVSAWLAEHDDELQCVVTECLPHSRHTSFGRAQHPGLTDYPDERDVIEFLVELK